MFICCYTNCRISIRARHTNPWECSQESLSVPVKSQPFRFYRALPQSSSFFLHCYMSLSSVSDGRMLQKKRLLPSVSHEQKGIEYQVAYGLWLPSIRGLLLTRGDDVEWTRRLLRRRCTSCLLPQKTRTASAMQ